jgi:protein-disulfide isomerase
VKSLKLAAAVVVAFAFVSTPLPAARKAGQPKAGNAKAQGSKPTAPEPPPVKAFGAKGAPITIEIFSDFECPSCRTYYEGVWRRLMENYVDTGKVYLIHRDMPLPMHASSRLAAQYADAAARIGKFEKVEEVLFSKQDVWGQSGDVDGTVASVLTPAEMAKVRQLVKGGQLGAAIERDLALGQTYRINQTPTTIITCKGQTYPVVGAVSYSILRQFLDQLLSQK